MTSSILLVALLIFKNLPFYIFIIGYIFNGSVLYIIHAPYIDGESVLEFYPGRFFNKVYFLNGPLYSEKNLFLPGPILFR